MRRSEAAFTLLEVMAAVALLGIVYTTLATAAMQGLRAEGVARRRMEASLLIDQYLADLERDLGAGVVPPVGTSEEELDAFLIVMEVRPFEPPPEFLDEAYPAEDAPSSFLAPADVGAAPVVITIDLTVFWVEGTGEASLRRTTFGYDLSAIPEPVLPELGDRP